METSQGQEDSQGTQQVNEVQKSSLNVASTKVRSGDINTTMQQFNPLSSHAFASGNFLLLTSGIGRSLPTSQPASFSSALRKLQYVSLPY